ncbi:glycosyltransferase family 2 protein [bacterium]|nr:glycosyltransferase family 2 protein [bacterium]
MENTEVKELNQDIMVTYVIASFNHLKYIKKAIDSVLNQTYKNIELIVCDDCSTDGSQQFLEKYSKEKGFRYLQNERNMGPTITTNRLIEAASGEYVCTLASDDWIHEDKVRIQLEFVTKNGLDGVFGPVIKYIEETDEYVETYNDEMEKIFQNGHQLEHLYQTGQGGGLIQSGLFRTACAKAVQFLPEYKSDDFLFQIRFYQAGYKVGYLNMPLTYYRIHRENSHADALYCLYELEMPVINDFIPQDYQARLMANSYAAAALKLGEQKQYRAAIKLQMKSLRKAFIKENFRNFFKADIRYIMLGLHIYKLYWKIRYHETWKDHY